MATTKTSERLSLKQTRFVQEYLVDLNGKHAAIRAGYSPKTAEVLASQTLRIPKVQAALAAAQAARARLVHLTQDAILHELALVALSDITYYQIEDDGNVTLRDGAPPDAMRAVASLKKKILHTEAGTVHETEVRLWQKPSALRLAAAHLGMLHNAEQPLPDVHVHIHTARDRLTQRLAHLAQRHAEDATHGH